jgi:hypothetical protein
MKTPFTLLALLLISSLPAAEPATKPYPLTTCLVTGNDLGSMGDEKVIIYEGQTIKFCCAPCETRFRKNPAKYLPKLLPPK